MYPPVGFHFRVDFLGLAEPALDSRFQEVSGLVAELDEEHLEEVGESQLGRRLAGRAKHENIVLRHGVLRGPHLTRWCEQAIVHLELNPLTVIVMLLNEGRQPLATWMFERVWPVKWSVSDFKVQENGLVVEMLELACGHLDHVQGASDASRD